MLDILSTHCQWTNCLAKMALRPFLRFLASKDIDPWRVTDEDAEAFREALWSDCDVPWPRRTARRAIKAWNKERERKVQWPQIELSLRDIRLRWGLPWSAFPAEFQGAVDQFFRRGDGVGDIFESGSAQLAPATRHAQKDLLRLAASALVLSGVKPATIVGLRNVCAPTAFRAALQQIVTIKGGVTSTVQNVAHVLCKVAKLSGRLSPEEVAEIEEDHKNLRRHQRSGDTYFIAPSCAGGCVNVRCHNEGAQGERAPAVISIIFRATTAARSLH